MPSHTCFGNRSSSRSVTTTNESKWGMPIWTSFSSWYMYQQIKMLSIPAAACMTFSSVMGENAHAKSITSTFFIHQVKGVLINSLMPAQGPLLIDMWLLAFCGMNSFSGKKNSTLIVPIISELPFAIQLTMNVKGQMGISLSWHFNLVASHWSHGRSSEFLSITTKWPSVTGRFNRFLKNIQATFIFQWIWRIYHGGSLVGGILDVNSNVWLPLNFVWLQDHL